MDIDDKSEGNAKSTEEKQAVRRTGFLAHVPMVIPEDFDRWCEDEILEMFGIAPPAAPPEVTPS